MRADPTEYRRLELRAHRLLAGVPLHDVWTVDLEAARSPHPMLELREALSAAELTRANPVVRLLFGLRSLLGRLLALDPGPDRVAPESFLHRLSAEDRKSSLVEPGTLDGPFRVLHVSPRESIAEVRNATVHAFSVFALAETGGGERLYWAIHVQPVGRITAWYMALIDPFRRRLIYPSLLRRVRATWEARRPTGFGTLDPGGPDHARDLER